MVEVPDPTAEDLELAGGYTWDDNGWVKVTITAYGTDALGSSEIDDAMEWAQAM